MILHGEMVDLLEAASHVVLFGEDGSGVGVDGEGGLAVFFYGFGVGGLGGRFD